MRDLYNFFRSGMMSEFASLSPEQEEFLRQQRIEETGPGTILPDFQGLLEFIGSEGIPVSKAQNFFSMKSLAEINARLSHPLEIDLNRPQQKSYSNIHGLYMLLRASGLSYIETKGKKYILKLEPTVLESWNSLNPTERYFNLLETWLLWGNEETMGLRLNFFLTNFDKCLRLWKQIPDEGLKVANYTEQQSFHYFPELYNIALLELFGLLAVEHGKPEPKKGWRFAGLKRSPWGEVLLQAISVLDSQQRQELEAEEEDEEEEDDKPFERTLGTWQSFLQPFFPEWQHNLKALQVEFRQGFYIFKVSLGKCWRRIGISADATLEDLSSTILRSMDFYNDHLHCFYWKNAYGSVVQVNHSFMEDEPPFTSEFSIGALPFKEGQSFTYLFDFGEDWEFEVKLERVEPAKASLEPSILEHRGKAPEQYPDYDDYDE